MRDILMFFYFVMIFLNFLLIGITNREYHQETLDAIHKLEYKIDSLQTKCDSLQNILKYQNECRRSNKNIR